MRVHLTIPDEHASSLAVITGPLIPSSVEDMRLLETLVRRDGQPLQLEAVVERTTDLGWTYAEIAARGSGEHRLAAMYRFAEWRGYVLIRCVDPAWEALEPSVRAALAAATPNWRGDGEVHCIAHLFE